MCQGYNRITNCAKVKLVNRTTRLDTIKQVNRTIKCDMVKLNVVNRISHIPS